MKNYLKMTMFVFSAILLLLSMSNASAYSYDYRYSSDSDRFSYTEDLNGNDRGFKVDFGSSNPEYSQGYTYCEDYDYYDWSYGGKNCKRSNYYGNRYYYKDQAEKYDRNKMVEKAFQTYQQSAKYDYQIKQLEQKRLELAERRSYDRYAYGYGHGHGYSGVRYYSYGW